MTIISPDPPQRSPALNPNATPFVPPLPSLTTLQPRAASPDGMSPGTRESVPVDCDPRFAAFGGKPYDPLRPDHRVDMPQSLETIRVTPALCQTLPYQLAQLATTIQLLHVQMVSHGAIGPHTVLCQSNGHMSLSLPDQTSPINHFLILPKQAFPVHSSIVWYGADGHITCKASQHMDMMAWAALHAYMHPHLRQLYEGVREHPQDVQRYDHFLTACIMVLPNGLPKEIIRAEKNAILQHPLLAFLPGHPITPPSILE